MFNTTFYLNTNPLFRRIKTNFLAKFDIEEYLIEFVIEGGKVRLNECLNCNHEDHLKRKIVSNEYANCVVYYLHTRAKGERVFSFSCKDFQKKYVSFENVHKRRTSQEDMQYRKFS